MAGGRRDGRRKETTMPAARLRGGAGPYARACLVLIAILVSTALAAAAQEPAGRIPLSGSVVDVTGRALPGARVEAVVAGRPAAETTTDAEGSYRLAVPADTRFELRVRLRGFADAVVDLPGDRTPMRRDLVLQVGGVSDTVVVTASRVAQGRTERTAAVSVLTAADLQVLGAASLAEALRFVPALSVEGNGREGSLTSLFARGGQSSYNLVLVDGVRVNQNGGAFDVSRLATSGIERVEVVRGAQSALWGSDAIGSVVQVFTARAGAADPWQVTGTIEGGTFGTRRGSTRLSGGAGGRFDYHGGVAYRGTDGAFADALPENDWFEQTTVDAGIGTSVGPRASLRTGLRLSRAQGRVVGPTVYGARNTGGAYDTRDLAWHLDSTHTIGSRFTGTAAINYFGYRGRSADRVGDLPYTTYAVLEGMPGAAFPDGVRLVRTVEAAEYAALAAAGARPAPGQFLGSATTFDFAPFESRTELRRPAVRYQGDYAWAPGRRLSAGYEWERESNPLVAAERLDTHAVFVQQAVSLADRWVVTAGVRADAKEGYGTWASPRLSAGGFLLPARAGAVSSVRVFGNIGRGIKAPLFTERLGAPWADPNPDLRVERARTSDLGVEATFLDQALRAGVVYFDNAYRDQIAYRFGPVGDGMPEFININGSRAEGWEIEAAVVRPFAGLTASGAYAFVHTEVVTHLSADPQFRPGQPLLRRPTHSGSLRAAWAATPRAAVHGDVRFVGRRHDSGFLFLQTLPNADHPDAVTTDITVNPGYAVVGLGATFDVHEALALVVRADNLGDARYESALGYAGLPRSATVGLRVRVGGP
jgi:vitamin B12 transporter